MTFKNVFSFDHIKQSFKVLLKKRDDGTRHLIILLVLSFGLHSLASSGAGNITIQYIRRKFTWHGGEEELNDWLATFNAVGTVFSAIAIGAILPIMSQVLKLNDLVITVICLTSFLLGLIATMLAKIANIMYLANFLQMFAPLATTAIRSALTKIVGSNDTGKVRTSINL